MKKLFIIHYVISNSHFMVGRTSLIRWDSSKIKGWVGKGWSKVGMSQMNLSYLNDVSPDSSKGISLQ